MKGIPGGRFGQFLLFAGFCGVGSADNFFWQGGDGNWDDPAMWGKSRAPTQDDCVYFQSGFGGRVKLTGAHEAYNLQFAGTEDGLPDAAPVTFYGTGTLTATGGNSVVNSGRELTVADNANVIFGAQFYVGKGDGSVRVNVLTGGRLEAGRNFVYDHGVLNVDGGEVRGNLTVFSGGTFRMTSGLYYYDEKTDGIKDGAVFDITGGTIVYGKEVRNGHTFKGDDDLTMAFWPDRAGKKLVVNSSSTASVIKGNNVGIGYSNDVYRLSGELYLTNAVAQNDSTIHGRLFVFTNAAIYGSGTLTARSISHGRNEDMPFDLGLPRIRLEEGFALYGSTTKYASFHGPTTFESWGDWARDGSNRLLWHLDGDFVFDAADCRDASISHDLKLPPMVFENGHSSLALRGGGAAHLLFQVPLSPFNVRAITVGAQTKVGFNGSRLNQNIVPMRDFHVGDGAELVIPFKSENSISNIALISYNDTVISPTAAFTAYYDYANVNGNQGYLYNVFTAAPGGDWPDPAQWRTQVGGEVPAENPWQLKVVGPSVYLSDGKIGGHILYDHWSGDFSGNISDKGNWVKGTTSTTAVDDTGHITTFPSALWFTGEKQTIVTNDVARSVKGLRVEGAAPFIVRGSEKLTIRNAFTSFGNSSSSIYHAGALPFIVECPLGQSASGGFAACCDRETYIALMGETDLSMATVVKMRGVLLVGGTFTSQALDLQPPNYSARATVFGVVKGGDATFMAQSTVLTNTCALMVCGGGRLAFTGGAFTYGNVTNVHMVDGSLDIQAPLSTAQAGADAGASDVGFAGTGVVHLAAVKSSPKGDSAVTLNGGVKLVPPATGWTTVTADAADHAITLALPEWGRATLAPTDDFVYGPASEVVPTTAAAARALTVGRFATLTLQSDADFQFSDPLVCGDHSTLVKQGAGALVWDNANSVAPECLKLEGGTLVWSQPMAVLNLEVASGTTLAFGAVDGAVASIAVAEGDVNLDGVTISPADAVASQAIRQGTKTLLTVGKSYKITGTPVLNGNLRAVVADLPEGGQVLRFSRVKGLTVNLR